MLYLSLLLEISYPSNQIKKLKDSSFLPNIHLAHLESPDCRVISWCSWCMLEVRGFCILNDCIGLQSDDRLNHSWVQLEIIVRSLDQWVEHWQRIKHVNNKPH